MATTPTTEPGHHRISFRGLLRAAALLLSGDVVVQVTNILGSVVLTRGFGVAGFGVYALINTTAGMTRRFLGFRTNEAVQRSLVAYSAPRDRQVVILAAMGADLLVNIASLIVVAILAPVVATSFGGGAGYLPAYYLCAATGLLGVMNAPFFTVARMAERFRLLAVVAALGSVGSLLVSFILLLLGQLTVWNYMVVLAIRAAIELTYKATHVTLYCRHELGFNLWRFSPWQVLRAQRQISAFWKLMATGYWEESLTGLNQAAESYMLGYFGSTAVVGFYRLAGHAADAVWMISKIMSNVVFMDLTQAAKSGRVGAIYAMLDDVRRTWRWILVGLAVVTMPLVYPAVLLLYGREFLGAVVPTVILLAGVYVASYWFWGRPLLLALGQLRRFSRIVLFVMIFALPVKFAATAYGGGIIPLAIASSLTWFALHFSWATASRRTLRTQFGPPGAAETAELAPAPAAADS
ncbi:MAG TPA: hypothetical protein DCZ72_14185 [Armatimonadetes bacterium]|nr:hypothetical protein [Armatimonadota bacterium]